MIWNETKECMSRDEMTNPAERKAEKIRLTGCTTV